MSLQLAGIFMLLSCSVRLGWNSPVSEWKLSEWELWKLEHNKVYTTQDDEESHRQTWEENYKLVEIHNQQPDKTFTLEMNFLADQISSRPHFEITFKDDVNYSNQQDEVIFAPSSWDWRQKGAISPVKNQGQLGDVVAMVGAAYLKLADLFQPTLNWRKPDIFLSNFKECVESFEFINHGTLEQLSVGEIHDCCPRFASDVFQCIHNIGGLCTASSYPLSRGKCMNTSCTPAVQISGGNMVPKGNEADMMAAVYQMPVMALVDASHVSFQLYSSGIYSDKACSSTQLDLALQVVGYGAMSGHDYWICRNSWGTSWGMDGYILIARNKGNMCGIASQTSYPV